MEWMTLASASDDVAIRGDRCPQCRQLPRNLACAVEDGPAPSHLFDDRLPLPALQLRCICSRGHAWAPRHGLRVRVAG